MQSESDPKAEHNLMGRLIECDTTLDLQKLRNPKANTEEYGFLAGMKQTGKSDNEMMKIKCIYKYMFGLCYCFWIKYRGIISKRQQILKEPNISEDQKKVEK